MYSEFIYTVHVGRAPNVTESEGTAYTDSYTQGRLDGGICPVARVRVDADVCIYIYILHLNAYTFEANKPFSETDWGPTGLYVCKVREFTGNRPAEIFYTAEPPTPYTPSRPTHVYKYIYYYRRYTVL